MGLDVERDTQALVMQFASQDSLRQRRGRAGRVQEGRCFRLITYNTYNNKLMPHSIPEILRVSLDNIVLQIKAMSPALLPLTTSSTTTTTTNASGATSGASTDSKLNGEQDLTRKLLARCIDPPPAINIDTAERYLLRIQALDADTKMLTALGKHLANLPCNPGIGRLLIYSCLLGCVYSASIAAACMNVRSPFSASPEPEIRDKVNKAKVRTKLYIHSL